MTGTARNRFLSGATVGLALVTATGLAGCGVGSSKASSHACPLTGTAADGGHTPQRAALAVKVDNAPSARPPVGLASADVIFEEPVEGGLTRFVAVFQCHSASRVAPVRSARLVDPDLLVPLSSVGLAHAGGIQPALDKLAQSGVVDVGDGAQPQSYHRDSHRSAPHNEYTSTDELWGHLPSTVPNSLFAYSGSIPQGSPAPTVHIPFSGYSNVTWRYDLTAHDYGRTNGSESALDSTGAPLRVDDVVVQHVAVSASSYVEDATGQHENVVDLLSGGPAEVYRDGVAVRGQWSRDSLDNATRFVEDSGKTIKLRPGRTWIELVPTTVHTSP
ncbi:MAG TPA: DUF3048 domain-containing protein [Frankiaceae bacterium]|nr:DUF3048 domain-containing protein [Frankiaceae bacterium]